MQKVFYLINSPLFLDKTINEDSLPPLGQGYIATSLKNSGIDVSLIDCVKEKITAFHGVPTMFIAMLGHENFDKTDFSHMRTGIMAGSPCPIKVMEEVINKMHMSEICITYGQTEASPATTMSKTTDSIETRVNTVGAAMFGVECKIVDPETGEEVGVGETGEIMCRGFNVMKGYYNNAAETEKKLKDSWLDTGDLGYLDEEVGAISRFVHH